MVEKDIERLRGTLERALAFAFDASGRREQYLSFRSEEAGFYGITVEWEDARHKQREEGRGLVVEIAAAAPFAWAIFPCLKEPLVDVEAALESLLSAILNVNLDEPASVLWERERDRTIEELQRARSGKADHATCSVCGRTFLENLDHLTYHFENFHGRPSPSVKRLISPEDQRGAIKAAAAAFRDAHDEASRCLTASLNSTTTVDVESSVGGKPPHPWRDIMLLKARERHREHIQAQSHSKEADTLLRWTQSPKLPLDPGQTPPARGTVANWLAQAFPRSNTKPTTKPR